jgi:hypothetical protein
MIPSATSIHHHRRRRIMALAALSTATVDSFVLPTPIWTITSSSSSTATATPTTTSLSSAALFNDDDESNSSHPALHTMRSDMSTSSSSSSSSTSLRYQNDKLLQQDEQEQSSLSFSGQLKSKSNISNNKPPKIHPSSGGRITLVGAGPGSPDLLTMAAHRIISDPANFIIVDRLVSSEILELIQGEYKVANKHPGCAELAQQEIYEWCKQGIKDGRHVVRLKIGE